MIVTSALDASRNWSSVLSRFGFGVLILATLSKWGMQPQFLDVSHIATGETSLALLPVIVLWVMTSMVIGAVAILLGSVGESTKFGELARVKRAYRVGKSGNPLLVEILRDANVKYELASGFIGVLLVVGCAAVLGLVTGLVHLVDSSDGVPTSNNVGWLPAIYGGAGGLTAFLIRLSATGGIEAIDKVLDQHFPEAVSDQ